MLHPTILFPYFFFFFFNDTATTEIYTLSLHDALPIGKRPISCHVASVAYTGQGAPCLSPPAWSGWPCVTRTAGGSSVASSPSQSRPQSTSTRSCRWLISSELWRWCSGVRASISPRVPRNRSRIPEGYRHPPLRAGFPHARRLSALHEPTDESGLAGVLEVIGA